MSKYHLFICICTITLALAGCSPTAPLQAQGTANPIATPATASQGSYPGPETQIKYDANGYPVPGSEQRVYTDPIPTPPQTAPDPLAGKASVSGVLYSSTSNIILPNTQAYFTKASGTTNDQLNPVLGGPKPQIGDIAFTTDDKGEFEFNNIPPGKYFLVVWAPLTWNAVWKNKDDPTALMMDFQPDKKTLLGVLYVSWP
jgi:hypothetical protein